MACLAAARGDGRRRSADREATGPLGQCYHLPAVDPWCSGPTCLPVTQEIAGSNPVGSAILRTALTPRRVPAGPTHSAPHRLKSATGFGGPPPRPRPVVAVTRILRWVNARSRRSPTANRWAESGRPAAARRQDSADLFVTCEQQGRGHRGRPLRTLRFGRSVRRGRRRPRHRWAGYRPPTGAGSGATRAPRRGPSPGSGSPPVPRAG